MNTRQIHIFLIWLSQNIIFTSSYLNLPVSKIRLFLLLLFSEQFYDIAPGKFRSEVVKTQKSTNNPSSYFGLFEDNMDLSPINTVRKSRNIRGQKRSLIFWNVLEHYGKMIEIRHGRPFEDLPNRTWPSHPWGEIYWLVKLAMPC